MFVYLKSFVTLFWITWFKDRLKFGIFIINIMSDLNQADTNEVAKQDNTEQSTVTPDQITRNIVKAKRRFADDEGEPV